jgi:hypothetical protein
VSSVLDAGCLVLRTYQEIRDRIYELARLHDLRPDWVESMRSSRLLLLYDRQQVVAGRAIVPVRHPSLRAAAELQHQLEGVFGKDWLE